MTADPGMATPLTWLFVPGDRPSAIAHALRSDAEAVIIDLEDAVAPAHKSRARSAVAELLASPPPIPLHVRINPVDDPRSREDIAALGGLPGLTGVMVPKVRSAATVATVVRRLEAAGGGPDRGPRLHCLLECARGVENARVIAGAPGVAGIGLGELDLMADLRVSDDSGLAWARGRIVVAARAAGLPPPPQSVFPDVQDLAGLARSCAAGRAAGFHGRYAIHPRQLPVIVDAYRPSVAELARALETIDALTPGRGAAALADGRFIDEAVVRGAREVVALADRYGTRRCAQ
jgi:citrate lyase subunit beta/citryl-CoA lyase